MTRKTTLWEFILQADKVHNFLYNYAKTVYINAATKITITCTRCGCDFEQIPRDHLQGKGCRKCSYIKHRNPALTTEEFVARAEAIHGLKYDYRLVNYVRGKSKVDIICPHHSVFKQTAIEHLTGRGCTKCSKYGFKTELPGFFYILKFNGITKIGITNLTVAKRVKDISKSSGMNFEVAMYIKFESGKTALDLETKLLRSLKDRYTQPAEKFDGSTECFYNVKHEDLLLEISNTCLTLFQTNSKGIYK